MRDFILGQLVVPPGELRIIFPNAQTDPCSPAPDHGTSTFLGHWVYAAYAAYAAYVV